MERGVQRWVVDISTWDPSSCDFDSALSLLPSREHSSILRFVRLEDRKRALVSRMLQYALVYEVLGVPFKEIIINRTLEGKPYLACDNTVQEFSNFNYNVSHHGDYVAIASEPLCLVGLDIVSPITPQMETVREFIKNFSAYFSSLEWDSILNGGTDDEILIEFYRCWCLKEAYVKAMGTGISYGLENVEFQHTSWNNISVKVNGVAMSTWRFWLFHLGKGHWASVARAHPRYASESYKRTLTRLEYTDEEFNKAFYISNPNFVSRTIEELIAVLDEANRSAADKKSMNNTARITAWGKVIIV